MLLYCDNDVNISALYYFLFYDGIPPEHLSDLTLLSQQCGGVPELYAKWDSLLKGPIDPQDFQSPLLKIVCTDCNFLVWPKY